ESGDPAGAGPASTAETEMPTAAAEAGQPAGPLPLASAEAAAPPHAARFEPRYIEHLVGRAAGAAEEAAPAPSQDTGIADADVADDAQDAGFEADARGRAYFLWEQDGRPAGRAEQYRQRAVESLRTERNANRAPGE